MNGVKVQNTRIQAQGDAKWDDIPEVDRVVAKFQNEHSVNDAYAKGGAGSKGNPGRPV